MSLFGGLVLQDKQGCPGVGLQVGFKMGCRQQAAVLRGCGAADSSTQRLTSSQSGSAASATMQQAACGMCSRCMLAYPPTENTYLHSDVRAHAHTCARIIAHNKARYHTTPSTQKHNATQTCTPRPIPARPFRQAHGAASPLQHQQQALQARVRRSRLHGRALCKQARAHRALRRCRCVPMHDVKNCASPCVAFIRVRVLQAAGLGRAWTRQVHVFCTVWPVLGHVSAASCMGNPAVSGAGDCM